MIFLSLSTNSTHYSATRFPSAYFSIHCSLQNNHFTAYFTSAYNLALVQRLSEVKSLYSTLTSTTPLAVCCFCEVHLADTWIIFHSTRIWRVNCSRRSYHYFPVYVGLHSCRKVTAGQAKAREGRKNWLPVVRPSWRFLHPWQLPHYQNPRSTVSLLLWHIDHPDMAERYVLLVSSYFVSPKSLFQRLQTPRSELLWRSTAVNQHLPCAGAIFCPESHAKTNM